MPVPWVNGVTPVDAPNLEIMEADIAQVQTNLNAHAAAADPHTGYQKEAERAAANGYAPLDGSAKVPLINLPPVSGVDYIGDWGEAIAYKKGDVVRYGGNDYMAVNDSTGVTPPAVASIPLGGVGMGTSLPAAPYDGQEYVLTDNVTIPTWQWRMRYNALSAHAEKWNFIGGSPSDQTNGGPNGFPAAGWFSFLPTFTAPRPGWYRAKFATYYLAGAAGIYANGVGLSTDGSPTYSTQAYGANSPVALPPTEATLYAGAGASILGFAYCSVAGASLYTRWLTIQPVRLA